MSQLLFEILFIVCGVGVVLQVGIIAIQYRRRNRRKRERRIIATVVQAHVEATELTSGWRILAAWADEQAGQTYTFRSPLLGLPPKQRVGDAISVVFDAKNPRRYRMEL